MRVNGEAFFLINSWMNMLCLLLASRMIRKRIRAGRALLSAFFGAAYGVAAWMNGAFFRSVPFLLLSALLMGWIAFGQGGIAAALPVFAAGWLLSGMSDFAVKRGAAPWEAMLLCGAMVFLFRICPLHPTGKRSGMRLEIWLNGKRASLPAFADNGNLLREKNGLPVIIAPEQKIKAILPEGIRLCDLSTLPKGWRLIGIRTAAGNRTLMCFHPDKILLRQGKSGRRIDAAVAVSDFEENRALLPIDLCADE